MSMNVHDMTDAEWEAYANGVSGEWTEWICDHGKRYDEDCHDCDNEWQLKVDGAEIIEASVLDDIEPDVCDHGKEMLLPKWGYCHECDIVCGNSQNMASKSCWRYARGKKWRYDDLKDEWVLANYYASSGASQGTGTSSWQKKKDCTHFMQEFQLENGKVIYASADRDAPYHDKRNKEDYPDLGVYLYQGWVRGAFASTPGLDVPWASKAYWPMTWLDWLDYSVPYEDELEVFIPWVMDRINEGKIVETGCMGGHGRTGTLLAMLLVQQGVKPGTAMKRVWDTYCIEAIESIKQVDAIIAYYESLYGKKWKQSKAERALVAECRDVFKPKTYNKPTPGVTQSHGGSEARCIHYKLMSEYCAGCSALNS